MEYKHALKRTGSVANSIPGQSAKRILIAGIHVAANTVFRLLIPKQAPV